MALYRGFSTSNWLKNKSLLITDVEAVKQDIVNHIFTRLGERVVMPNFGTRIPELAFDPNDEETLNIIEEDIITVIKFDPRVELKDFNIFPLVDNNAIIVNISLYYVELDITDVINIDIKSKNII